MWKTSRLPPTVIVTARPVKSTTCQKRRACAVQASKRAPSATSREFATAIKSGSKISNRRSTAAPQHATRHSRSRASPCFLPVIRACALRSRKSPISTFRTCCLTHYRRRKVCGIEPSATYKVVCRRMKICALKVLQSIRTIRRVLAICSRWQPPSKLVSRPKISMSNCAETKAEGISRSRTRPVKKFQRLCSGVVARVPSSGPPRASTNLRCKSQPFYTQITG